MSRPGAPFAVPSAHVLRERARTATFAGALLAITSVKMWLDEALALRAESSQSMDDALYARLAASLLRGEWLGPYDWLTLAKNPGYPLWLAAVHRLGLPLLLAQGALYAAAGLLFVRQLRRLGVSRVLVVCVYAMYELNTFVEIRLLREGIYGSLLVLIAAAGASLLADQREGRVGIGSAVGLGLALSAAWITREESVALLPMVAVFLAPAALSVFRADRWRERLGKVAVPAVPFAVVATVAAAIAFQNFRTYGVARVNDVQSGSFPAAVGAIQRVRHLRPTPYLPVPADVRARLYRVSPAYASLAPFLDGPLGSVARRESWRRTTCTFYEGI
jgi:hypothetical protein